MKAGLFRAAAMALFVLLYLVAPQVAQAHTIDVDACPCDWCFALAGPMPDDVAAALTCDNIRSNLDPTVPNCECGPQDGEPGEEVAWFDAPGDNNLINDLATLATTSDATNLYFLALLYNDPDPNQSIPNGQLAFDVAPGGNTTWRDLNGVLAPADGAGQSVGIAPDYLLVFDFSDFPFGGGFVNDYAKLYEATTSPGVWTELATISVAVDPGVVGGAGGLPGKIELAIPWSAFAACEACPTFDPETPFSFSFIIPEGVASPFRSFTPTGPIEEAISEAVAGTYTTTDLSCAPGAGSTTCELADNSSDAFVRVGGVGGAAAGAIPDGSDVADTPLTASKSGSDLTLSWDASCLATDTDYSVYEGTLGDVASRVPVTCSTEGLTTATFTPAAGDTFYLVVPNNGTNEGSSGTDSDGAERPAAAMTCLTTVIETCP